MFITDLTPGGSLEADLDEPGGGTYAGESASADSQGDFTFSPRWPPHFSNGGLTPTGNYRIVIRDQTAGATATAILQVAP